MFVGCLSVHLVWDKQWQSSGVYDNRRQVIHHKNGVVVGSSLKSKEVKSVRQRLYSAVNTSDKQVVVGIQYFCMTINGSDRVEDSIVIAIQFWTIMAINNNFIGKQKYSCLSIING
jgi:hypothetical protein